MNLKSFGIAVLAVVMILVLLIPVIIWLEDERAIETCKVALVSQLHEASVVVEAIRPYHALTSRYVALKTMSVRGLGYYLVLLNDSDSTATLISYETQIGVRVFNVTHAKAESILEIVLSAIQLDRSGIGRELYGGQSCEFFRVHETGTNVDGMYVNLAVGAPSLLPQEHARNILLKFVEESTRGAGVQTREVPFPPTYTDEQIYSYLEKLETDQFFELAEILN